MRSNGWSLAVSIFRTFYIFRPLHEICPEPQAGDSLLREAIRDGIFDPLRHESLDYVLARSRTSHYLAATFSMPVSKITSSWQRILQQHAVNHRSLSCHPN